MLCDAATSPCVRHDFPPVAQLKSARAAGTPWPTVVIHTLARDEYRPDIDGPLSLFVNLRGKGRMKLENRWLALDAASFAVSDAGQTFTLEYERPVEALNFYFADDWVKDVAPDSRPVSRLGLRDARFDEHLARVLPLLRDLGDPLALEQALLEVLVLTLGKEERHFPQRLAAARAATRDDLRRRLRHAIDYMVAYGAGPLSLAELARVACLSNFHFLRSFKALTGVTPARYLAELRVERAQQLLRRSPELSLSEVAHQVGFSESAALSRAFRRLSGVRPGSYRSRARI
jgi:AraC family transcriptional regulator